MMDMVKRILAFFLVVTAVAVVLLLAAVACTHSDAHLQVQ